MHRTFVKRISAGNSQYRLQIVGGVPQPGASGTPSTGTGQLVNINTASADELRTNLHVSSTTAQNIVNYRMQHGPYTSIDQLLQVISKSIYDRIKNMVTI